MYLYRKIAAIRYRFHIPTQIHYKCIYMSIWIHCNNILKLCAILFIKWEWNGRAQVMAFTFSRWTTRSIRHSPGPYVIHKYMQRYIMTIRLTTLLHIMCIYFIIMEQVKQNVDIENSGRRWSQRRRQPYGKMSHTKWLEMKK